MELDLFNVLKVKSLSNDLLHRRKGEAVNIKKEQIKALDPCTDAWDWYLKEKHDKKTPDLTALLIVTNEEKPEWARWLFTRLMTVKQRREIAIFAAEQVLPIFEKKYPYDNRPRKAIEAAKAVLANYTPENRKAATAASANAYAAVNAATAYAADAAYAAATASAYATAYAAANAADAAADAAANASAYARKEMQEKIIVEAARILERDERKKP